MPQTCAGCTVTIPTLPATCAITKTLAGINAMGIVSCSNTTIAALPDDITVWQAAVTANEARVVKLLLGEQPDPNDNMKRLTSCFAEEIIGRTNVINIEDYDMSFTAGTPNVYDKWLFYNDVMANASTYNVYWTDCNGRSYYAENVTITVHEVKANNSTELSYFKVKIAYLGIPMAVPFDLNLNAV